MTQPHIQAKRITLVPKTVEEVRAWGLKSKRKKGLIALALGSAVCGRFVVGLRWLY